MRESSSTLIHVHLNLKLLLLTALLSSLLHYCMWRSAGPLPNLVTCTHLVANLIITPALRTSTMRDSLFTTRGKECDATYLNSLVLTEYSQYFRKPAIT